MNSAGLPGASPISVTISPWLALLRRIRFSIAFDVESLVRLQACECAVAPQLRQIDGQLALYARP